MHDNPTHSALPPPGKLGHWRNLSLIGSGFCLLQLKIYLLNQLKYFLDSQLRTLKWEGFLLVLLDCGPYKHNTLAGVIFPNTNNQFLLASLLLYCSIINSHKPTITPIQLWFNTNAELWMIFLILESFKVGTPPSCQELDQETSLGNPPSVWTWEISAWAWDRSIFRSN